MLIPIPKLRVIQNELWKETQFTSTQDIHGNGKNHEGSVSKMTSPLVEIKRKDGKVLKFIYLEMGILELVDLKEVDMRIFHHNLILEKLMLLRDYPEEPPHHYVAKDNLPMMVEA